MDIEKTITVNIKMFTIQPSQQFKQYAKVRSKCAPKSGVNARQNPESFVFYVIN